MKYTRKEIEKLHQAGKKLKYLFFWGHRAHPSGETTSSCFSQWWNSSFEVGGIVYPTAEHWMMAEKARLFNDPETLEKIIHAKGPAKAKQLGRQVIGFNQQAWEEKRMEIVVKGNLHKFSQNPELKAFLLNTGKRVLVEASPVDKIWGIGMDAKNEFCSNPMRWKGLNLLGFALMEVRDLLNNEVSS